MIVTRSCGGCKHFFRQSQNPSECHYYPPRTTVLLLGVDPKGQPILHKVISSDLTHEGMEACGQWAPKLEGLN